MLTVSEHACELEDSVNRAENPSNKSVVFRKNHPYKTIGPCCHVAVEKYVAHLSNHIFPRRLLDLINF